MEGMLTLRCVFEGSGKNGDVCMDVILRSSSPVDLGEMTSKVRKIMNLDLGVGHWVDTGTIRSGRYTLAVRDQDRCSNPKCVCMHRDYNDLMDLVRLFTSETTEAEFLAASMAASVILGQGHIDEDANFVSRDPDQDVFESAVESMPIDRLMVLLGQEA